MSLRAERQAPADRLDLLAYWAEYALRWAGLAARSGHPMLRLDNAHSTHLRLLYHLLPLLRKTHPHLSILGEYFETHAGNAEAWVWRHGIERLLATPWMDPFASQKRRLLGFLDTMAKTTTSRHFVPLCSHDSPSAAEAYGGPSAVIARYAAIAFFSGGCTGLVQGSEWARRRRKSRIHRLAGHLPAGPIHARGDTPNQRDPGTGRAARCLLSHSAGSTADHGAVVWWPTREGLHGPLLERPPKP